MLYPFFFSLRRKSTRVSALKTIHNHLAMIDVDGHSTSGKNHLFPAQICKSMLKWTYFGVLWKYCQFIPAFHKNFQKHSLTNILLFIETNIQRKPMWFLYYSYSTYSWVHRLIDTIFNSLETKLIYSSVLLNMTQSLIKYGTKTSFLNLMLLSVL